MLVSKNYTAKRHWHKVVSTEPTGGGRYTRYNLACSYTPWGDAEDGHGHISDNMAVTTTDGDEPVDVFGAPMGENPNAPEVTVCADCFVD